MAISGKQGIVKVGSNTVASVTQFSVTITGSTIDASSMNSLQANSDWKSMEATTKEWNGSLTCNLDASDTNGQNALVAGSTIVLNLYPEGDASGKQQFSGNAIITGITLSQSVDGKIERSFNFVGDGALTESAVA